MAWLRRAGFAAALVGTPFALAYRFALLYRRRAGYPRRRPILQTPTDLGLPFEPIWIDGPGGRLPGWFVPARGGARGPGVVLVHGWESNRARMLPNARFLVAAGFHCLLFDVRGHGENPPELLPVSAGEFAADAVAAVRTMRGRPEVTSVGLLGHSMGAAGAIVAAADEEGVAALVSTSAPADPRLMTRETFRLAHLPIPGLIAPPLAWLVARVYVRPRGHRLAATSARRALARYTGPVLLVQGTDDEVVPLRDLRLLQRAAAARGPGAPPAESLAVAGGLHRWLYEDAGYRRTIAAFLAAALGGPLDPAAAGEVAAAVPVSRPPDTEGPFASAIPREEAEPLFSTAGQA